MPKDKKLFSAAECSKHVYEDLLKPLPEGITAMRDIFAGDVDGSHIGEHYNDSLRARIYELNSGEIYVAFRGSDGSANWLNHNIPFLYGSVSNDYKKFAEQVVAEVSKSYSGKEITVTGHSAGGVMGILAALATGWTCYGLDVPDIGDLDFSKSDFSKITLVQSNSVASGKNYSSAHGVKIINVPNNGNPFNAHRISYIISQLENAGEISAFDELYENFNGKENLLGVNEQTKNKLDLLIKNFYRENRKKAFQEVISSANAMYGDIQKIGLEVGSAQVVKVGEVGGTLVKLHQSFLGLEINIPLLSSVTKLASFLNPVVGVVSGMFSLLSAFGIGRKRKDGLSKAFKKMQQQMQVIQQNIQALHQEIRDSFQMVFNNQQKIYEAVIHLGNYMINDFKMPVMESLTSLEDEVHRLQIISGEAQKTIFFQPLEKCLQKLDMYLQGDIVYSSDADEKIISQLGTLSYWIETGSTEALANGSIYLEGHGIGHEMEWVKRVLTHNASLHGLLGYLAANAEQITGEVMQSVDKDQLMNLAVWYTAVSCYLDIVEKFKILKNYKPNRVLLSIVTQADNALNFINNLSENSVLYENLFRAYSAVINNIVKLIDEKFEKMCREKTTEKKITLTVDKLFVVNTGERTLLEQYLTQLDAIQLLLNAYVQLSGLNVEYGKIHLLSRQEILKTQYNFSNTSVDGSKLINSSSSNAVVKSKPVVIPYVISSLFPVPKGKKSSFSMPWGIKVKSNVLNNQATTSNNSQISTPVFSYEVNPPLFLSEVKNSQQFLQEISSSSVIREITTVNQFSDVKILLLAIKMRAQTLLMDKSLVQVIELPTSNEVPHISTNPYAFLAFPQNLSKAISQIFTGLLNDSPNNSLNK